MKKTNTHLLSVLRFFSFLSFLSFLMFQVASAQDAANDIFAADDDDLNVGGDIFSDFNEDVESTKLVEDERFYRYGRFFSFNASIGLTAFDGNRGIAYENQPPTFGMSFTFFKDFQSALTLGLEYSKHSMFLKDPVLGFPNAKTPDGKEAAPGLVEVSMLRVFLGYRYYIETANLGTAITYSNPYLITRIEYWYQNNKYVDQTELPRDTGGGLGFGLGFGLEFPIEYKESYVGLEFLFHTVNFPDKNTEKYAPLHDKGYGFANLGGNAYSTMVSYVFNW
jgi:hypothetical protein